ALLLRPGVPGLGRLRMVLFQGLVNLILRDALLEQPVLDPAARDLVLSETLARLAAEDRLAVLGPIAGRPGLARSVAGLLAELKRAGVRPAQWRRAAEARGIQRQLDIAAIYEAYQEALERMSAVDPDDLGLWALDALVRTHGAFFRGDPDRGRPAITRVLVDGYQDFTPVQLAWLQAAASLAPRVTVYLEYDPDRPELYGPTERTVQRLEEIAGGVLTPRPADGEEARTPALRRLAEELFRPGALSAFTAGGADAAAQAESAGQADATRPSFAVEVLTAQGEASEAREVARVIKLALRDDPDLSPGDVAVVYRELGPQADLLAQELRRAGIPCDRAETLPLVGVPVVQAALCLLAAAAGPGQVASLLAVAKCGYVKIPHGPQFEGVVMELGATLSTRQWQDRLEAVLAGLRREQAALAEARPGEEPDLEMTAWRLARDIQRLEAARSAARSLLGRLGKWPDALTPADAAQRTRHLLDSFRLREAVLAALQPGSLGQDEAARLVARDLQALERLEEAVQAVAAALAAGGAGNVAPSRWYAAVAEALTVQDLTLPHAAPRGRAAVRILPAAAARRLRFRLVIMAGMLDGVFPKVFRPDWLLPDREREDLRAQGIFLDSRRDLAAAERLTFYQAATCATRRLVFAYPAQGDDGSAQHRSFLVQEAVSLFPPETVRRYGPRAGQLWPDRWEEAAGLRELLEMAVLRAAREPRDGRGGAGASPGQDAALLAGLKQAGALDDSLWPRLEAQAEREGPYWGPFDGRLAQPNIVASLADRYGRHYAFSASQLSRFGVCPFSFFAERVLRLAPLEEAEPEADPLEVGNLYHQILYAFWSLHRGEAVDLSRRNAYLAELRQVAEVQLTAFEAQGLRSHPGLWRVKRAEIIGRVLALLDWELDRTAGSGLSPTWLEMGFGVPGLDPDSRPEPIWIGEPQGGATGAGGSDTGFFLKGKMDRLDLAEDGGFMILDYKTGVSPSSTDIEVGRDLQVPLYLEAARALLGEGHCPLGGGYESIRLRTRTQGLWKKEAADRTGVSRGAGVLSEADWEARLQASLA
ncbi:MAG: PD-(D/E)XK nuclease family protein, partial [Bacillota bacterium]